MAPRLKILMTSGQRKEPRYTISILSKVPANEPPPGSPAGPLWRETLIYRVFCISLKDLIKIPIIIRPQERNSIHIPQKRCPYGNRRPFMSLA